MGSMVSSRTRITTMPIHRTDSSHRTAGNRINTDSRRGIQDSLRTASILPTMPAVVLCNNHKAHIRKAMRRNRNTSRNRRTEVTQASSSISNRTSTTPSTMRQLRRSHRRHRSTTSRATRCERSPRTPHNSTIRNTTVLQHHTRSKVASQALQAVLLTLTPLQKVHTRHNLRPTDSRHEGRVSALPRRTARRCRVMDMATSHPSRVQRLHSSMAVTRHLPRLPCNYRIFHILQMTIDNNFKVILQAKHLSDTSSLICLGVRP